MKIQKQIENEDIDRYIQRLKIQSLNIQKKIELEDIEKDRYEDIETDRK